jgi:hypothetical protein
MGMLARNLTPADIYNPNGVVPSQAYINENYAGKYIVFNSTTARYSDVDPWSVQRWGMVDYQYVTGPGQTGYSTMGNGPNQIVPRVLEAYGGNTDWFFTRQGAYYINDLWSINENHSLQGGLRVDTFKTDDVTGTFHSYVQPTLRFEYKWDMFGDQSRVFNLSWGQFHSAQSNGTYSALSVQANSSRRTKLWNRPNPDGSNRPYLVDKEDILNMDNYGYLYSDEPRYSGQTTIDPDFKTPISTEISAGLRRNLPGGAGYWKATMSYRTWANEFDWYAGDIFINENGLPDVRRVLRNTGGGYERRYFGLELEWDVRIHKRITFGGSYTFNRLMSSFPSMTDTPRVDNPEQVRVSLDWWFDQVIPGGRDAWRPVRILDPEHYIKWYLLFDFSSGKFSQSLALRGTYTSSGWQEVGYNYNYGVPYYPGSPYNQFYLGTGGGNGTGVGTTGPNIFSGSTRMVPFLTNMTGNNDNWGTTLRYNLSIPLVQKVAWLVTMNMNTPFNHRGLANTNFSVGGTANGTLIPNALTGSAAARNMPYLRQGGFGDQDLVWGMITDVNTQYIGRMGGRTVSVTTGIKF